MIKEPPKTGRPTNVNSHTLTEYTRMLSFVARWAPFDHGDEYILPEFGLQPTMYYRRLLTLLLTPPCPRLDPPDRQRIITLCQHKLDASRPAIPD